MLLDKSKEHLSEKDFFTLIKLFEIFVQKKQPEHKTDEYFWRFSDLQLGSGDLAVTYNQIASSHASFKYLVIFRDSPHFIDELEQLKKKLRREEANKDLISTIEKIVKGTHITSHELGRLSWKQYNIYNNAVLKPISETPDKKERSYLSKRIYEYLDAYINDELKLTKKNYYKFETQKRTLINLIQEDKKILLYGDSFIIREQINNNSEIVRIPDFCLLHTVYAMQKIGYLAVTNIWSEWKYSEVQNHSSKYYVNVNLTLNEEFINEINSSYKKDNPAIYFENFDKKRGVLKFAGQLIELSKNNKETDAVLLMNTLEKSTDDEWIFHDEILENWGYNLDDQKDLPKNKVYFAGQKINNAVAIKTQIEDFIECNTSKARINPKYKRVDK